MTSTKFNTNQHEDSKYFATILRNVNASSILNLREMRRTELYDLLAILPSIENAETLRELIKHLCAALNMTKVTQQHPEIKINEKREIPPNKNSDKQLRYFSTKKKKQTAAQGMGKPSLEEYKSSVQCLEEQDIFVCGYCHKEDDSSSSDKGCMLQMWPLGAHILHRTGGRESGRQ